MEGREAIVCQRRSATGSAAELFPEDVHVSGVPGGLARHVGHDPPERVPVAVDRDDEARFWVADVTDRMVAVLDCRPVVPQHVNRGAVGGDGHAVFPAAVPGGPGEVVAECRANDRNARVYRLNTRLSG